MAPIVEHPRFEALRLAGQGGMGAVFQARDRELDEIVALKVLSFPDSTSINRFRREVRIARNLQHPYICRVFDIYDLPNGNRALSMAWIEGESLSKRLRRQPLPSLEQVLEWGVRIADALDYAHARGVVHRDIKPGNIIIDREERPIIVDFGIARELDRSSKLTQAGDLMGTPAYMAPEQLVPAATDARTDLFALGVILGEMLLGEIPGGVRDLPTAVLARVINPTPVDLGPSRPELPKDLIALVRELTAPDVEARPTDGQIVAARLRALRSGATEPDLAVSRAIAAPSTSPSLRFVGAAAAAALALAGLAAAGGWGQSEPRVDTVRPQPPPSEGLVPVSDAGLTSTAASKSDPIRGAPNPTPPRRRERSLPPAEDM
ncbi:MAG: serine/threonine-protein kinase [Myxococcota bacterium]